MTTHSNQPQMHPRTIEVTPEPVPRPSNQFRRKAWREFQRALDPLAPPKPLRQPRH